MSYRLACNIASYGSYRENAFAHLQSLGVRYVEVPIPPKDQVNALEEALEQHNLTASTLMADCPLQEEDVAEKFHHALHVANRFGVGILFVSVNSKGITKEIAYERLRQVGDAAADHGVRIAVETHPDLANNGRVSKETMEAVDHPAVGINFDTANVLYYADGPTDTIEELKKTLPWVISVHLKDYSGTGPEQWAFPTLGQGHVNFREVFRLLEGRGYDGPVTLEIEGVQGEELSEEQMQERVAESVRYARSVLEEVG
ncbi:MAG: sugar phosphate isomerase/epimerase [Armatimonadetes bacterium]|nr:sugar phosphate isomerase/epimerase [Armatimonadota bacterium]